MTKIEVLFKVKNQVIVCEPNDLSIDHIIVIKKIISEEYSCTCDEIDVEFKKTTILSEYDVSDEGMYNFTDGYPKLVTKVKLLPFNFEIGSDEHLDAINDGTILDYLIFC